MIHDLSPATLEQLEQRINRITSYNVCYTKLLREDLASLVERLLERLGVVGRRQDQGVVLVGHRGFSSQIGCS